jgi:glycosyltransferase involved in cell wall biosynthesis
MAKLLNSSRRHDVMVYLPSISMSIDPQSTIPGGGAETQMLLVAKGLARLGASVCVVAFDAPTMPDTLGDVGIVTRPPRQVGRGWSGKTHEATAIRQSLTDADADIVIARVARPSVAVLAALSKLQHRRFVYSSASDSDFHKAHQLQPKKHKVAAFLLGLRLADLIVVQSDEQRGLCEERLRRTPLVIKSIAERAPMSHHQADAFLWVGRIHPCKRPLAYVELARAVPEASFWMVGVPEPGAHGDGLLREVRSAALSLPNLEFLAQRPRDRLMALVERAVAVVNTSEVEGLSNLFLEGWARGIPVLSLDHDPGGVIERRRLGGFAGGSPDRLATMVRRLWEGRQDQIELAERCQRYVREEHSPEAVCARWFDALGLGHTAELEQPGTVEVR